MKEIEGYKGYFITEDGRVFSKRQSWKGLKELKCYINVDGYRVFTLYKGNGKRSHVRAARLVALAFIENTEPTTKTVVNHIDHVKTNDKVENLEWTSVQENVQKSVSFQPEKHKARSKVSEEQVHHICSLIESGYRNCDIVKSVGVGVDIVKHIRSSTTWTEISKDYKLRPATRCAVSPDTAKWVWEMTLKGLMPKAILEITTNKNLSASIIKKIKNGKLYPDIKKEYQNKLD